MYVLCNHLHLYLHLHLRIYLFILSPSSTSWSCRLHLHLGLVAFISIFVIILVYVVLVVVLCCWCWSTSITYCTFGQCEGGVSAGGFIVSSAVRSAVQTLLAQTASSAIVSSLQGITSLRTSAKTS